METKKYRSRIKAWAIFFWRVSTSIAETLTSLVQIRLDCLFEMFSRFHCINLFIALNISIFFFPYFKAFISFACRDRFFVQYRTAWTKEKRQVNGERFNGIPNIFDLGRLSLNQPHISIAVLDAWLDAVNLQRKIERHARLIWIKVHKTGIKR